MFFPKLRRKAKWVFAFLAAAFALSFVVAGVGTGFGSGFGDYLAELFNRTPGTGQPSVDEAREQARANPNDAEAQLTFANALQTEGRYDEAIATLEAYTEKSPRDVEALEQLASLYLIKATEAEGRARTAQVEGARAFFGNEVQDPESKFTQGLEQAPFTQLEQQEASMAYSTALTAAQESHAKEAEILERLTKLQPNDSSLLLELGRAHQQANNSAGAIKAYEAFLELAPEDVNAEQVREVVKQLKEQRRNQPGSPTMG